MKVAAVRTLPFHAWVLADTVAALRAIGVEVEEFDHVPRHAHDWAQNNGDLLRAVGRSRPDALLMADYPYDPFVIATGAPVFATRHSLAARGNTYAPEQEAAHYLATFGEQDERLLDQRGVVPKSALGTRYAERLRVGCPWAGPLLTGVRDCGACWRCVPNYPGMRCCSTCGNKRCPHATDHFLACSGSNEPGQAGSAYSRDARAVRGCAACEGTGGATYNNVAERLREAGLNPPEDMRGACEVCNGRGRKPIVAWCPTWNDWSPDIAAELAALLPDVRIVYRPHYATAWRNPEALVRARAMGFEVDDPLAHPAGLLLQADVLVGDVSGIVLLALAVPGAALPIVQVDPPDGTTGAQIEKWGPEWTLRARIGTVVNPHTVALSVRSVLDLPEDRFAPYRREVRAHLFGVDPLLGGLTPGQRLAREIVARIG